MPASIKRLQCFNCKKRQSSRKKKKDPAIQGGVRLHIYFCFLPWEILHIVSVLMIASAASSAMHVFIRSLDTYTVNDVCNNAYIIYG